MHVRTDPVIPKLHRVVPGDVCVAVEQSGVADCCSLYPKKDFILIS